MASTIPSTPRTPNPPGTSSPSTPARICAARSGAREVVARHPLDVDADVVGDAAVDERFLHALVAVGVVGVLADDGDANALVRNEHALDELAPVRERGRRPFDAELLKHLLVEALLVKARAGSRRSCARRDSR